MRKITRKPFKDPRITYIRDFILNNNSSKTESIALRELMFDELALDNRHTYATPIPMPFVFLGVWIKPAVRGQIRHNEAIITEDDPIPQSVSSLSEVSKKVYERGCCRTLVDEYGYVLHGNAYSKAKREMTHPHTVCKISQRPG